MISTFLQKEKTIKDINIYISLNFSLLCFFVRFIITLIILQ